MIKKLRHIKVKIMLNRVGFFVIIIFLLITNTGNIAGKEPLQQVRLETDQLLNYYRARKNLYAQPAGSGGVVYHGKCGFWIGAQVINNWNKFSQAQQIELSVLMQPNTMQCYTIAGHFRIFYDTSGINAPSLIDNFNNPIPGTAKAYIDSVASIFNHVWSVEVDQMGYTAPPFQSGQQYYDVYVEDLTYYGATTPIGSSLNGTSDPPRFCSYIEIDNDYKELGQYNSYGISGLGVTAAHEFHHAIQFGYGFWSNETYAYELTSTWFEDVLYTNVNDYYNYLPDYFVGFHNGLAFNSDQYGGYERCIWAHYLAKRFNPDIMRDIWSAMRSQPFLQSNEAVISAWGSDLKSAFAEFTYWNYFTKNRANPEKYYPEGANYPLFQPLQQTPFSNGTSTVNENVDGLSSSFYEFDLANDTLNVIVANVDVNWAINEENNGTSTSQESIGITLSTQPLSQPYTNLTDGLNVKVSVSDASLWRYFFSQDVIRADAAPNPFLLATAQRLLLPINDDRAQTAEVYFYTSSLSLALSGLFNVVYDYGTRVIVVSSSEIRSKLSSGIYFVVAKTADHNYKWKVAVIR